MNWVLCSGSYKARLAGLCSHLEAHMGKSPFSPSFKLSAELISRWLYVGEFGLLLYRLEVPRRP